MNEPWLYFRVYDILSKKVLLKHSFCIFSRTFSGRTYTASHIVFIQLHFPSPLVCLPSFAPSPGNFLLLLSNHNLVRCFHPSKNYRHLLDLHVSVACKLLIYTSHRDRQMRTVQDLTWKSIIAPAERSHELESESCSNANSDIYLQWDFRLINQPHWTPPSSSIKWKQTTLGMMWVLNEGMNSGPRLWSGTQ